VFDDIGVGWSLRSVPKVGSSRGGPVVRRVCQEMVVACGPSTPPSSVGGCPRRWRGASGGSTGQAMGNGNGTCSGLGPRALL